MNTIIDSSTEQSLRAAAARGALWFDANEPGWYDRVNLERLDISSICNCIWGQLHCDYAAASERVQFASVDARVEYGFTVFGIPDRNRWIALRVLTDAWQDEVITRRLHPVALTGPLEAAHEFNVSLVIAAPIVESYA